MDSSFCRVQADEGLEKGVRCSSGLASEEVGILRRQHGSNEVKAQQTPEWRKVRLDIVNVPVNVHWKFGSRSENYVEPKFNSVSK